MIGSTILRLCLNNGLQSSGESETAYAHLMEVVPLPTTPGAVRGKAPLRDLSIKIIRR